MFTALVLSVSVVSSCNTMKGLGEDAKAAGQAISGAADKNKSY